MKNVITDAAYFCMRHAEPEELVHPEGSSYYYCPSAYPCTEENPDGYTDQEDPCPFKLSLIDAENILLKYAELMKTATEGNPFNRIDFTNMTFEYGNYDVQVLKGHGSRVQFGVIDRRITRRYAY